MFEHLSVPAQQAIDQAEAVAHRLAHHYIGTEHVLVGLARCPGTGAQRALATCAIDGDRLEAQLEELLGRGQSALNVRPPFTSSAMLVLERARWEARQCGVASAGTAHLLVALLRLPHSTAETVLRGMGVDPASVASEALRTAGDGAGDVADDGVAPPQPTVAAAATAGGRSCGNVAASVSPAATVPVDEPLAIQVVRLRHEVAALRAELTRLAALVEGSPAGPPQPPAAPPDPAAPTPA